MIFDFFELIWSLSLASIFSLALKMAKRGNKEEYLDFARKMTKKRVGSVENAPADNSIVKDQEIKVQLLAPNAAGAAKKYARLSGFEFVKYPFQTVSLDNIIAACKSHYKGNGKLTAGNTVEVLQNERGPACSKLSHILKFDIIYVHFKPISLDNFLISNPLQSQATHPPEHLSSSSLAPLPFNQKSVVNFNLPVSAMLRLGKVIKKEANKPVDIEFSEFDIQKMEWKTSQIESFFNRTREVGGGGV